MALTNQHKEPPVVSIRLSHQAWAIHNFLQVLHATLPDDQEGAAVPTRCLIGDLLDLTEPLALELMDLEDKLPPLTDAAQELQLVDSRSAT